MSSYSYLKINDHKGKETRNCVTQLRYYIKTHDSESRVQEEAAIIHETKITRPLSELFTRKTNKKLLTL